MIPSSPMATQVPAAPSLSWIAIAIPVTDEAALLLDNDLGHEEHRRPRAFAYHDPADEERRASC
jgi:hypothetical protein